MQMNPYMRQKEAEREVAGVEKMIEVVGEEMDENLRTQQILKNYL